jgi:hypothetical protein
MGGLSRKGCLQCFSVAVIVLSIVVDGASLVGVVTFDLKYVSE